MGNVTLYLLCVECLTLAEVVPSMWHDRELMKPDAARGRRHYFVLFSILEDGFTFQKMY